ncbi:MAG TPA: GYF domain-containing protein [Kofleriaceae bacterium]
MKFLCDRCKTRYSIGDDRVRGKILKIRCKNCANVITVREGMTADDVAASDRNRPTTAAPLNDPAPANGALASAFANQLTKPPPALEEEWYVSIDGEQSGPYSLSDAQRWIANKAYDADVHCWSEGFDDWLPVDKVSHFRGLRKKPAPVPAPTSPPPFPRVAPGRTGPAAAMQQTRPEDLSEPKPLFAATMASIERAAGIPPSPQTPPNGVFAKANGTGSAPVPRFTDNGRAKSPAIPSTIAVNKNGSGSNRPSTVQGLGQSAGAKALAAAFDASESAAASVDAPAFPSKPALASVPEPESNGAPHEGDDLDIGEVSRVVNLADLMKAGNAQRKNSRAPVATMRATGSTPKLDAASLGISVGATASVPSMPEALESPAIAAPVVAQAHRRGLIMLIGVASVLLVGVAVLVVVMVQRTDEGGTNGGLAQNHAIDTSRPEDIVFRQLPGQGSGSALAQKPIAPIHHWVIPHNQTGVEDGGEGKGDKLKSDEIEDMARKQSAGTQRCYMRAQRGAEGIEIADLKKLSVTLTVDKTGVVTDVGLNEHGTDTLGQCLIGQIKRWKFRESPGGLYRIILAFAS